MSTSPESIVVSLEWAKKLKKAGWPQAGGFYYRIYIKDIGHRLHYGCVYHILRKKFDEIAAPTAAELLQQLPVDVMIDGKEYRIEMLKRHGEKSDKYYVNLRYYRECIEFIADSLADAAAACFCYLAGHKLL